MFATVGLRSSTACSRTPAPLHQTVTPGRLNSLLCVSVFPSEKWGHWHRPSHLGPLQGLRGNMSRVGPPATVLGLLIAVDVRWAGVWRMEEGGEVVHRIQMNHTGAPSTTSLREIAVLGTKKKKKWPGIHTSPYLSHSLASGSLPPPSLPSLSLLLFSFLPLFLPPSFIPLLHFLLPSSSLLPSEIGSLPPFSLPSDFPLSASSSPCPPQTAWFSKYSSQSLKNQVLFFPVPSLLQQETC